MREIHVEEIRDNVAQICIDAAYNLSEDVLTAFDRAEETETAPAAREIIGLLKENARIAREERIPICQDTGIAIFFVEIGQDLRIKNGFISDAINEGVRKGYKEGYLRKSVVDPLTRKNTGDNTPAIIYTELVPGDKLRISFMPKGGGSENMSAAFSKFPPIPTPMTTGGHGFAPALRTHSSTKPLMPSTPSVGRSMRMALMFSLPPPLGLNDILSLSPGTRSV